MNNEPWLTKESIEARNARLTQQYKSERNSYIAFGIAVVLLTMSAMFLFSGCASLATQMATAPYMHGICTVTMKTQGEC